MSQLRLLQDRRFASLFYTQFLGAFNDNVFKNALVILLAYRSVTLLGLESSRLVVACAGLFILPFFLFSATAGQLADRLIKAKMIRWVKGAEIIIMTLAGIGFATDSLVLLLFVLFLMGLQSAFFGPAKYSILPELVDEHSLVGANALVETGTFLAILLGTIVGGLFVAQGGMWINFLGLVVVCVAVMGFVSSLSIPYIDAIQPDLRVNYNPITPTISILKVTRRNRTVFLSVLGISWFWFFGASVLTLLPNFSKDVVGGNERVVTFFLGLFCVGIAVGSLLCERLSRRRLELGLVPLGSIGISLFTIDLGFAGNNPATQSLLGVGEFLAQPGGLRIAIDLFLIAVFSGFYTVPLYTLVQQRSKREERSQVIAGNNILNALFMVASSLLLMSMLGAGATIPQIFLVVGILNALVTAYIYTIIPEFLLRFSAWIVANIVYRLRLIGDCNIPEEGAGVIVSNHVSFVDWLLIASASPRPVRFVMDASFMKILIIAFLFRDAKVIPIASAREDNQLLEKAFDRIAEQLEEGEIVCIFPEGRITSDGEIAPFRLGIDRILARSPVPVVPIAIRGMWGSYFSRFGGEAMSRPFRRWFSRIEVHVGQAIPADAANARSLAIEVATLAGQEPPEAFEEL